MPMKQEGSRSNSATSNRPSKWSNATHNNNRGCRRSSSRHARIRRLSRRRKSLNSPLAAGRGSTLNDGFLRRGGAPVGFGILKGGGLCFLAEVRSSRRGGQWVGSIFVG